MQTVSATSHDLRPADPNFFEGKQDGDYYYNAARTPWRIAIDALINNDPVSKLQTQRIAGWISQKTNNNHGNIKAGYKLSGLPIGDYFSILYAAPFGIALMTMPNHQQFLNKVYSAVFNTHDNYYEDTITFLCLLVMTANYWSPGNISSSHDLYWPMFLPGIINNAQQ